MKVHTIDRRAIVNELQYGGNVSQAISNGRRADFALLMSMLSDDVREQTPIELFDESVEDENGLRSRFSVAKQQDLRSSETSYERGAKIAEAFHDGGLLGARFLHDLRPDALTYLPEDTYDLPENVYHNLSNHERKALAVPQKKSLKLQDMYLNLIENKRTKEINVQI